MIHFALRTGFPAVLFRAVILTALPRVTFKLDAEHIERYRRFAADGFFAPGIAPEDRQDFYRDLNRATCGAFGK